MSNIQIESDLKEILTKIDGRLERIETDISELKVGQARLEEKVGGSDKKIDGVEKRLDEKIDSLEKGLSSKIDGVEKGLGSKIDGVEKGLGSKIDGLDKRVGNQEFVNRGILIALIVAILGGFAKLFGIVGNP